MPASKLAGRLLVCALLLSCTQALADNGGNMDLQSFRPALDSKGMVTIDRSQVLAHLEPSFGLVTNWAGGLLSLEGQGNSYQVEHILSPTLVAALGLRPLGLNLQLGIAFPFRVVSGDRGPNDDNGTLDDPNDDRNFSFDGQGLGDIDVQLKWRLLNTSHSPFGLALIVGAQLPTSSETEKWLGSNTFTPHVRLALDREFGSIGLAANLGVRLPSGKVEFVDNMPTVVGGMPGPVTGKRIAMGMAFPLGVGVSYSLVPQSFDLVAEVFGQYAPLADNFFPIESLVGAKFYLAQSSFLSLGAGRGLLANTPGNPDWRAYLGIVFEPKVGDRDHDGLKDDVDRCPDAPEDYDDFHDSDGCPDLDNDKDQIPDLEDQCPNTPEDRDGVDDDDGCPEDDTLDRDGDGLIDIEDECPDDPEDKDEYEDSDGCPDVDNDSDRILDIDDLCPDSAEDYDGFEDSDGCPEADNDGDRILDADDECPRLDGQTAKETSEVYNTVLDEDGCPDHGPVTFTGTDILILKKIHFEYNSARIMEQSFEILHAVAMTIETNPHITLVEVQGHTDSRGSSAYNKELSQRRAESVLAFLMQGGVSESRLQAMGYGEEAPKQSGETEEAWAANRRVEFVIQATK